MPLDKYCFFAFVFPYRCVPQKIILLALFCFTLLFEVASQSLCPVLVFIIITFFTAITDAVMIVIVICFPTLHFILFYVVSINSAILYCCY